MQGRRLEVYNENDELVYACVFPTGYVSKIISGSGQLELLRPPESVAVAEKALTNRKSVEASGLVDDIEQDIDRDIWPKFNAILTQLSCKTIRQRMGFYSRLDPSYQQYMKKNPSFIDGVLDDFMRTNDWQMFVSSTGVMPQSRETKDRILNALVAYISKAIGKHRRDTKSSYTPTQPLDSDYA